MGTRSSSDKLYGVDCHRLGSLYASALLSNVKTQLTELTAIKKHKIYKGLDRGKKREVLAAVRSKAQNILIVAGYPRETVMRIVNENTQTL